MSKEEIEIIQKEIDNKYLKTQDYGRNQFVCKIVELERYIGTLQSRLDIANKKLDQIKDKVICWGEAINPQLQEDILSIIGGE